MEIAEILFAQSGLLIHFDSVSWKWRRRGRVGGQGVENPFGCFARAAVWRGEEVEGIIWAEERAELSTCLGCLGQGIVNEAGLR